MVVCSVFKERIIQAACFGDLYILSNTSYKVNTFLKQIHKAFCYNEVLVMFLFGTLITIPRTLLKNNSLSEVKIFG